MCCARYAKALYATPASASEAAARAVLKKLPSGPEIAVSHSFVFGLSVRTHRIVKYYFKVLGIFNAEYNKRVNLGNVCEG